MQIDAICGGVGLVARPSLFLTEKNFLCGAAHDSARHEHVGRIWQSEWDFWMCCVFCLAREVAATSLALGLPTAVFSRLVARATVTGAQSLSVYLGRMRTALRAQHVVALFSVGALRVAFPAPGAWQSFVQPCALLC